MRRRNGALDRGYSRRLPRALRSPWPPSSRWPAARPRRGRRPARPAGPAGSPSLTSGIGPITFAIGSDDISWLTPVLNAWNAQPPRPAGHPAVPARGGQRPARAAGRQPAGQIRRLRRHRPGRGVDGRVRLGGLDHPAAGRQVPAGGLPAAGRRHRPVPGPPVRDPLLQQRRPALLPLRHPQAKAHQKPPTTWAQLQSLAAKVAPKYHLVRLRGHARAVRGPHRQLRRVGPVGGRVDPVPRRHARSRWTRRRPWPASASWSTGSARGGSRRPTSATRRSRPSRRSSRGSSCSSTTGPTSTRPPASPVRATRWSASSAWSRCPAMNGPGSSSLGGANLAISAYSQHQQTALDFISYLTDLSNETAMLTSGGFPPVWKQIYSQPEPAQAVPLPARPRAGDRLRPAAPGQRRLRPSQPRHLQRGASGAADAGDTPAGAIADGVPAGSDHPVSNEIPALR